MAIKDALLPEFDHEMGTTRRLLERVPDADLGWKPHHKSYSLGQLAAHIANLPHWLGVICDHAEVDAAAAAEEARPKVPATVEQLLNRFDENVKQARRRIDEIGDSGMMARWTLKDGGREIFSMPRASVLRSFVMNHMIHHRGQLTVYLRLRDVPLPSIYGPTADEG
ncbi:MAG: DinB family protein [Vicinamibacterales bacterium]